jgi:hypothetical protein
VTDGMGFRVKLHGSNREAQMSALGQKQTSRRVIGMSALCQKRKSRKFRTTRPLVIGAALERPGPLQTITYPEPAN